MLQHFLKNKFKRKFRWKLVRPNIKHKNIRIQRGGGKVLSKNNKNRVEFSTSNSYPILIIV